MIVRELCSRALRLSGSVAQEATISAADMQTALEELNDLLAQWSLESWWNPLWTNRTFTTANKDNDITVNPAVTPRLDFEAPYVVDKLYINDGGWIKMERVNVRDLAFGSGSPRKFAYGIVGDGLGVLSFDKTPDKAYEFKMLFQVVSPPFELDDEIDLPKPWEGALVYGVAGILSVIFGAPDAGIQDIASSRFKRIQQANIYVPEMQSDYPNERRYNIRTGEYE